MSPDPQHSKCRGVGLPKTELKLLLLLPRVRKGEPYPDADEADLSETSGSKINTTSSKPKKHLDLENHKKRVGARGLVL